MPAAEVVALVTGLVGCVTSVVTVTPCVRLPLEECYGHLKDLEQKLQTLRGKIEELEELARTRSLDSELRSKVYFFSYRFNRSYDWGLRDSRDNFLWGCLPNYYARYKKGKNIAEITGEANSLIDKLQREPQINTIDGVSTQRNRGHLRIIRKLVGIQAKGVVEEIHDTIKDWRLDLGRLTTSEIQKHLIIGVCGGSGVGRTEVVAHVYNKFFEEYGFFDSLIWVEAPYEDDIKKLQMKIASKVDLILSNDETIMEGAALLTNTLLKKKRFLLILDNISKAFPLEDIGVQPRVDRCTVIIISRHSSVCREMKSEKIIWLKSLSDPEAYELLNAEIGPSNVLNQPEEIQSIVKNVAEECCGWPMAIVMAARQLRRLDWKCHDTLRMNLKMELAAFREYHTNLKYMEDNIVPANLDSNLKLGYLEQLKYINNSCLQACFLFCTMYPRNHAFVSKELIEYWIWDGLLGEIEQIDEKLEEAKVMLDKLKDACILESTTQEKGVEIVKLHPFIWDFAVQTNKGSSQFFGKAGQGLTQLLYEDWPEDVERVSLMRNNLKELQPGPRFLKLSTLLLQHNPIDNQFHHSFFNSFPNLKQLDLSNTGVCILPESLFSLRNLNVLFLRNCWGLTSLPSLSKLEELMVLDVSGSPITELPSGMNCLTKLISLDLSRTQVRSFPPHLVTELCNLQELLMINCEFFWLSKSLMQPDPSAVGIEDIRKLQHLNALEINFANVQIFLDYIGSGHWHPLKRFKFCVGGLYNGKFGNNNLTFIKEFPDDPICLPDNTSELLVMQCGDITHLTISNFQNLKVLDVSYCAKLKYLFELSFLPYLQNLEEIVIAQCPEVEKVIEKDDAATSIRLPRLQKLTLFDLPELQSICDDGILNCDSLETIAVWLCGKLKIFPVRSSYSDRPDQRFCTPNLKQVRGEKSWFEIPSNRWEFAEFAQPLFIEESPPEELISRVTLISHRDICQASTG